MASFEVEENFMTWVRKNVNARFKEENIQVTENALKLIALTMQMQITEEAVFTDQQDLFRRTRPLVQRLGDDVGAPITEYYKTRYGHKKLTFNRAFHMLERWGIVLKYPWKRTGSDF